MTVTASELFLRAARIMGARTGTVGTVAVGGSTTTAVLTGLKNTTGDNMGFPVGDRLMVLHDSTDTFEESLITAWVDATGVATFKNMATAPVANDAYMVWNKEDYSLFEIRSAFEKALNETSRTYRQVVPIVPNLDLYPLSMCDWLTGDGDIDAVWISESPNDLHNEDFALWQDGSAAAPDGWTLSSGDVARVAGGIRSAYAASVTAGTLYQSMPQPLVQWITRRIAATLIPIRAAAWLSEATAARVGIYDGSTTHWSTTTYTGTAPSFVEVSHTPTASDTDFRIVIDGTFKAHAAVLMQNTQPASLAYSLRDQGSQAYYQHPMKLQPRNIGGIPTIELTEAIWTLWQLIAYVRRPFPAYESDADVFETQYARVLVAGLLNFLLEAEKPQQDRARLDRIRGEQGRIWTRMNSNIIDLPVPQAAPRQEVWGA